MFIFTATYYGRNQKEMEEPIEIKKPNNEYKSYIYKFKNSQYKEPLGKEGLRKKIEEILGEENKR